MLRLLLLCGFLGLSFGKEVMKLLVPLGLQELTSGLAERRTFEVAVSNWNDDVQELVVGEWFVGDERKACEEVFAFSLPPPPAERLNRIRKLSFKAPLSSWLGTLSIQTQSTQEVFKHALTCHGLI
ncbi:unnamed protein product [Chrysoparadoxa australica]